MNPKNPRVLLLHVVDRPQQFGGVEKFVLSLAQGLSKSGIPVALAVNEGCLQEAARTGGIKIFSTGIMKKSHPLAALSKINAECQKFQPDVVHSHHRYTTLGAQVLPFRKFCLIHTLHVELFDKRYIRFFGDHATAVSQAVKNHFVKYFGANPAKITLIYYGVEAPAVLRSHDMIYMPRKNPGQVNLVVIGRLEKQKGHEFLIQALDYISPQIRERLSIAFLGEGSRRDALQKMISERCLSNVEIMGFQSDIGGWLEDADFSVLPSLWEGFPLAILESYQCTRPVIATNVAGSPEAVKDGETGILVPPRDPKALAEAIVKLILHPELIKQYGEAGQKLVDQNFSYKKMISQYIQLYQTQLKRK